MFYLYLKTHNQTGLKYLGKTSQNPYNYSGSGKHWKHHLRKHGLDVSTEILKECETEGELKKWGIYYSKLWNVVESKEFANLTLEKGDGGVTPFNAEANKKNASLGGYAKAAKKYPPNRGCFKKGHKRSKESVEKQRKTITGKKRGPYKWKNGYGPWNKKREA